MTSTVTATPSFSPYISLIGCASSWGQLGCGQHLIACPNSEVIRQGQLLNTQAPGDGSEQSVLCDALFFPPMHVLLALQQWDPQDASPIPIIDNTMRCTSVSTPGPHRHTIRYGNITASVPVQKTSDKVSGAAYAMRFDKINSRARGIYAYWWGALGVLWPH